MLDLKSRITSPLSSVKKAIGHGSYIYSLHINSVIKMPIYIRHTHKNEPHKSKKEIEKEKIANFVYSLENYNMTGGLCHFFSSNSSFTNEVRDDVNHLLIVYGKDKNIFGTTFWKYNLICEFINPIYGRRKFDMHSNVYLLQKNVSRTLYPRLLHLNNIYRLLDK